MGHHKLGLWNPSSRKANKVLLEDRRSPVWLKLIGGVCVLAATAMIATTLATDLASTDLAAALVGIASTIVLLLAGAVLILARIRVAIENRTIVVEFFPIWKKRVAIADLAHATEIEVKASDYLGLGFRMMPGRVALLFDSGTGVLLTLKGGKTVAVRCERSAEIVREVGRQSART